MTHILCLYSKNIFSNGESYILLEDGKIPVGYSFILTPDVELDKKLVNICPLRAREYFVIDSDLKTFKLPIISPLLEIISDQSGVIAFYGQRIGVLMDDTYIPPPNNAAIYNIDGTLRHQLINPRQEKGWYIHSTYYADFASLKGYGVMVTNDHEWPELCFCLYDGTPNLIWTGYQVERR